MERAKFSIVFIRALDLALGASLPVGRQYCFLNHSSCFGIVRISYYSVAAISLLPIGHRNMQFPAAASDDLELSNLEAVIERNACIALEFIVVFWIDPHFGDLHVVS
jgi:hypothetical protein